MNKERLKQFIYDTNAAGYASGDSTGWKKEKDGSTTIEHKDGNWKSRDNFYGGEPYGGSEVVFHKGKVQWMMVYWGKVEPGTDRDKVYEILQNALKHMPKYAPFRGPKKHKNKNWTYTNSWEGDVEEFRGKETIHKGKKQIYWAGYMGGLVDQNK